MATSTSTFGQGDKAVREAAIWIRKLDQITRKLDKKKRKEILDKAAVPIVNRARKKAKKGRPRYAGGAVSIRYDTPKATNKLRAGRGHGVPVAAYFSGNLALSISILKLRKSFGTYIGPKMNKRGKGKGAFGKSDKKVDGYYAQMAYGSAKTFFQQVMLPAVQSKSRIAVAIAKRLIDKEVKEFAKSKGLD